VGGGLQSHVGLDARPPRGAHLPIAEEEKDSSMPAFTIRDEREHDAAAIRAVTLAAFANMPYSRQTEAAIVEALRAAGALTVSLVAIEAVDVVGHVAFSPASIDGEAVPGWYGVGPLSVRPDRQRSGIGSALMREGIARLRALGGKGCVVVGDPAYYQRFGFQARPGLTVPGVPPEHVRFLDLEAEWAPGVVAFHPGFAARDD
jgi:putative acetyltransferase